MNPQPSAGIPKPSHPINTVEREDILARAEDRRNICRIMSWAHLYVSIRWSNANLYIGIPSTVFAAIASMQTISEFGSNESNSFKILHLIFSSLVAGLAPLLTFLNPSERANGHKSASRVYEFLGDRYDEFLLKATLSQRSLAEELENLIMLNQEYGEAKKPLPLTPEWAFHKAEKKAKRISLIATMAKDHTSTM
ncbi:MAG: SLATT domain-containing protein [Microcoleaceae cyanobacterium]